MLESQSFYVKISAPCEQLLFWEQKWLLICIISWRFCSLTRRKSSGWGNKASILGRTEAATRQEEQDIGASICPGLGLPTRIGEGVVVPAVFFPLLSLCLVPRSKSKVSSLIHKDSTVPPDLVLGPSYFHCSPSCKYFHETECGIMPRLATLKKVSGPTMTQINSQSNA